MKPIKRHLSRPLNRLSKESCKSMGFQCSKSSINLEDDNSFGNFNSINNFD